MIFRKTTFAIAAGLFALQSPASAETYTITADEDNAPYSFIPFLVRSSNPSLYAYTDPPGEDGSTHSFEAYVGFPVGPETIPEDESVTSATISLIYAFDFDSFGDTNQDPGIARCYEVLEAWSENTLNWNNRPDAGGINDYFDEIVDIDSFGALTCDATALVSDWINNSKPNYGIALKSPTERVLGINSTEAEVIDALKPTLIIQTEVVEAVPTMSPLAIVFLAGVLSMGGASVLARDRGKS